MRDGEPKRWVQHIHYMGVDVAYQHTSTTEGPSIASQMFATIEAAAQKRDRYRPGMPWVIEVELANEHARAVYSHWEFEHLGFETKAAITYERMWRPPTEP